MPTVGSTNGLRRRFAALRASVGESIARSSATRDPGAPASDGGPESFAPLARLRLTAPDRLLWAWLSAVWREWQSTIAIVKPATVIGWHRQGFRLFWHWKIRRGKPGRPGVPKEIRSLIRKMSRDNPLWGAPRIHGELLKLDIDVGETSVSKYMIRHRHPPSQTWRTFLDNHVKSMVSIDFFTVPTLRFQVLYVFVVLAHDRRRIVHFNVTAHPTAEWTGQQLREAFPFDQVPRYLLRDRDGIFGCDFTRQVKAMGIQEVLSAPRSPWQRAYVERVIGTIRRECLDHVIVFSVAGLQRPPRRLCRVTHHEHENASQSRQRRTGVTPRQTARCRTRRCDSPGSRPASPLRPRRGVAPVQRPCPLGATLVRQLTDGFAGSLKSTPPAIPRVGVMSFVAPRLHANL